MKPDLIILLSGGYDSSLLLHLSKKMGHEPVALLIDYGQKHVRELESAVKLCASLAVNHHKMTVDLANVPSGLTGNLQPSAYRRVHAMHVPGRNTIFIGLALSLAESLGATKIWYGANYEDKINRFADCTQAWVHAMNRSLKRAASYPIELEAPLLGMRKDTIIKLGVSLFGLKVEDTHSGYEV